MQQPVLLDGGSLSPMNAFYNPVWMNSPKGEDGFNPNDPAQLQTLQRLSELNRELDEQLVKIKPNLNSSFSNQFNIGNNPSNNSNYLNSFKSTLKVTTTITPSTLIIQTLLLATIVTFLES